VIGGVDATLPGSGAPGEGEFVVLFLKQVWPDLVVQDASADEAVLPADPTIAGMAEFFVYRSRAAFESWAKEGASEENSDTMIHVILGPESTTFVADRVGAETHRHAMRLLTEVLDRRAVLDRTALDSEARPNLRDNGSLPAPRRGSSRSTIRRAAVAIWLVVTAVVVALVDRVGTASAAFAAIPSLAPSSSALQASFTSLDHSVAALGATPASSAPPVVESTDSIRAHYTEAEYEDELAYDLMRCEPEAMLRYEATVPFWVYANPALRKAIVDVMLRNNFNGIRWIRAANGDTGVSLYQWSLAKDPVAKSWTQQRQLGHALPVSPGGEIDNDPFLQARNRLVRMSAACVNIFFDGSLLSVDRRGSDLTVLRRTRLASRGTREAP
jgi:hypothetical protein